MKKDFLENVMRQINTYFAFHLLDFTEFSEIDDGEYSAYLLRFGRKFKINVTFDRITNTIMMRVFSEMNCHKFARPILSQYLTQVNEKTKSTHFGISETNEVYISTTARIFEDSKLLNNIPSILYNMEENCIKDSLFFSNSIRMICYNIFLPENNDLAEYERFRKRIHGGFKDKEDTRDDDEDLDLDEPELNEDTIPTVFPSKKYASDFHYISYDGYNSPNKKDESEDDETDDDENDDDENDADEKDLLQRLLKMRRDYLRSVYPGKKDVEDVDDDADDDGDDIVLMDTEDIIKEDKCEDDSSDDEDEHEKFIKRLIEFKNRNKSSFLLDESDAEDEESSNDDDDSNDDSNDDYFDDFDYDLDYDLDDDSDDNTDDDSSLGDENKFFTNVDRRRLARMRREIMRERRIAKKMSPTAKLKKKIKQSVEKFLDNIDKAGLVDDDDED